jgi:hypothetical protein
MNSRPTVANLRALKGVRQLLTLHVDNVEEAMAASEVGIDMINCEVDEKLPPIRAAAPRHFEAERLQKLRIQAFSAFAVEVRSAMYPAAEHEIHVSHDVLEGFERAVQSPLGSAAPYQIDTGRIYDMGIGEPPRRELFAATLRT